MKIKVCGLKEKQNIQDVLALHPDLIGLIFYPGSKRYVGNDTALSSWLRPLKRVGKTGVFVDAGVKEIQEKVRDYALDYVQLHGLESPETCAVLHAQVQVIKTFAISDAFDFKLLDDYCSSCTYFLFDTPTPAHGGSGQAFDWAILKDKPVPLPFFLSGGIGPGDAERVKDMHHRSFAGIDLNSRFEQSPGIKNIQLLKTFIDEIRN